VVLTLLPPKEESGRELLVSHSTTCRVCKKRQPLFVASTRKRMREMGSMEKRPGSAGRSKGKHAFQTM
jgi:hypothetical protein